jgi:hypothetical protein
MTDHDDLHEWAGAYAAGALDRDDRARFEDHLRACPTCQATVADLLALVAALGRMDEADLGPVEPAPRSILDGAVARATAAQQQLARSRSRWRTLAVAAAVVAVLSVGARWLAGGDQAAPPTGTEVALAGSATGSVELVAKGWGTQLRFSLQGLPADGPFVATVRDSSGRHEVACTWGPTRTGAVTIDGATSLSTADLSAVEITDLEGRVLAAADLAAAG